MSDVVVSMPGEVSERVLALLVGGEKAGVCRPRARDYRRHAADGPATTTTAVSQNSPILAHSLPTKIA